MATESTGVRVTECGSRVTRPAPFFEIEDFWTSSLPEHLRPSVHIRLLSQPKGSGDFRAYRRAYVGIYNAYAERKVLFTMNFDVRACIPDLEMALDKWALTESLKPRTRKQVLGAVVLINKNSVWKKILDKYFKLKPDPSRVLPARIFTADAAEASAYLMDVTGCKMNPMAPLDDDDYDSGSESSSSSGYTSSSSSDDEDSD